MKAYVSYEIQLRDSLCIIEVLEFQEREKGAESLLLNIMAENCPNLKRELDIPVHEVHRCLKFQAQIIFSRTH